MAVYGNTRIFYMRVKEGKNIDLNKNKFVQVVNLNVIHAFDIMVFVFDPKYIQSLEYWVFISTAAWYPQAK